MKYCPKCGTQNPDEGRFCRNCGYSFPIEKVEREEEIFYDKGNSGATQHSNSYPSARSRPRRFFLWMTLIIIVLGAGGFGAWKFVIEKKTIGTNGESENIDLEINEDNKINPEFVKFIGDWYSDDANIKRTRISAQGDRLLIETFFEDGIDSCYTSPSGNIAQCGDGNEIVITSLTCIQGYFGIEFCKR
jgi:hypothetical protein